MIKRKWRRGWNLWGNWRRRIRKLIGWSEIWQDKVISTKPNLSVWRNKYKIREEEPWLKRRGTIENWNLWRNRKRNWRKKLGPKGTNHWITKQCCANFPNNTNKSEDNLHWIKAIWWGIWRKLEERKKNFKNILEKLKRRGKRIKKLSDKWSTTSPRNRKS